jgi:rhomboid family GlyGly-CTERM serine protease
VNKPSISSPARARLRISGPWLAPLTIALLCVALSVGGDSLQQWLRYERAALEAGELWRLLSGHLVHLGTGHLILNLAALGVLGLLFADALDQLEWVLVSLASALAIDIGLYWLSGDVQWYVGLSGVLHGLMAAGSLSLLASRTPGGLILLSITISKLLLEQFGGALPYSELTSGGPVIVDAHLYGALGGGAGLLAARLVRSRRAASL